MRYKFEHKITCNICGYELNYKSNIKFFKDIRAFINRKMMKIHYNIKHKNKEVK